MIAIHLTATTFVAIAAGFVHTIFASPAPVINPATLTFVQPSSTGTAASPTLFAMKDAAALVQDPNFSGLVATCSVGDSICAKWLRILFHDAGTFNTADGSGGADGSLQFEADREENAGLGASISFFKTTRQSHASVSYADIVVIGAAMSVQSAGGPQCPFNLGRVDATQPNPNGRLPDTHEPLPQLIKDFARMGLTKTDLLTLASGAHTLGGVTKTEVPTVAQIPSTSTFTEFDSSSNKFDTDIFQNILNNSTVLPSDLAMNQDASLVGIMKKFTATPSLFNAQWCTSFSKLANLGQPRLSSQRFTLTRNNVGAFALNAV